MDDIYRRRQVEEGGADPFEDARSPEGDPSLSAAGAGRGDAEAAADARALREAKHREFHETVDRPAARSVPSRDADER